MFDVSHRRSPNLVLLAALALCLGSWGVVAYAARRPIEHTARIAYNDVKRLNHKFHDKVHHAALNRV